MRSENVRTENDIELCRITSVKAKEKVMYAMMKSGIPYAEEWEKVPLTKRRKFHGAKEVCAVITHRGHEEAARDVIDTLESDVRNDVVW